MPGGRPSAGSGLRHARSEERHEPGATATVARWFSSLIPAAARFLQDETGSQPLGSFNLQKFADALFPKGALVLENMAAGQLANGGSVALNINSVGGAVQIGLPVIGNPASVTGTLSALISGIPAAAEAQGLTSVIIRAQNVTDELAQILIQRYGFTLVQGTKDLVLAVNLNK